MFSQAEIDAVLSQAQQAVDTLVQDVEAVVAAPASAEGPVATSPPPPLSPPAAPSRPITEAAVRPAGPVTDPRRIAHLLRLKVPVVVRLAERRMPVGEILKIVPGTILEFERDVDRELDLLVSNHQIGAGVAVKVDEHFRLQSLTNAG